MATDRVGQAQLQARPCRIPTMSAPPNATPPSRKARRPGCWWRLWGWPANWSRRAGRRGGWSCTGDLGSRRRRLTCRQSLAVKELIVYVVTMNQDPFARSHQRLLCRPTAWRRNREHRFWRKRLSQLRWAPLPYQAWLGAGWQLRHTARSGSVSTHTPRHYRAKRHVPLPPGG